MGSCPQQQQSQAAAMQGQLQLQQPLQLDTDPDNTAWTSSDEFRMYHFKITLCSKRFNHDWNFCPYAHTGERACRRDPQRHAYTSITCLDMLQKGKCSKGGACTAAHSVFEFWLHPHRYRTEMCKVGAGCNRRICFFAHKPEELRPLPDHLATTEGSSGGKYSLSAALPPSARDSQKGSEGPANQQQGSVTATDKPGELTPQQQRQKLKQQQQQQVGFGGAAFLHGVSNSSSSSSTSIVNLSGSMLGCSTGGGSNSNSPSAAASWLLTANRDNAAAAAAAAAGGPVLGYDGLAAPSTNGAYAAVSAAAAMTGNSPQRLYSTPVNSHHSHHSAMLPPRIPQHMATAYAWQQQQQQQLMGVQAQGALLPLQHAQQQQQQAAAVSAGLALQLQQLSLTGGDLGAPAAPAAAAGPIGLGGVTAGFPAAAGGGLQREYLAAPGTQVLAGSWQQGQHQQQQMMHAGASHLVPASNGHLATAAGPLLLEQQQQQMLLQGQQGQACLPASMIAVTAAQTVLCGVPFQQQYSVDMPLQQQFLQHGQGFGEACWH